MTVAEKSKQNLKINIDSRLMEILIGNEQRTAQKGNNGHTWFQDVWIPEHDCSDEAIKLQKGETCDAMWATADKIKDMIMTREFLGNEFYLYFYEMMEIYANA